MPSNGSSTRRRGWKPQKVHDMTETAIGTDATAARIAATFDPVFALVDGWRDTLARAFAASIPNAAALDALVHDLVAGELASETRLITGAGFVAAPGFLKDAPWHLAWWLRRASGIERLQTVDDPDADEFRDYTTLEWWRVPAVTGARHLTGPYVDYLCTDDYTVTVTTPVVIDGTLTGMAGVDVYVARLEQELLPVLQAGAPCTLVNASARVVSSTVPRTATGALLRRPGLAEALAPLRLPSWEEFSVRLPDGPLVVACGDTSLALVVET